MQLKAFELYQNGYRLFLTSMKVSQLSNEKKVKTDEFDADRKNEKGYQRKPTVSRVNQFGKYVSGKGVVPTSVTLSVREDVNFTKSKDGLGTLEISDDSTIWIIDGQHRIKGLRKKLKDKPDLNDFDVPVVIMPIDEHRDGNTLSASQAEQSIFVIINKTQKGVRTDLAERFLGDHLKNSKDNPELLENLPNEVTKGIEWMPKATDAIDILRTNNGPWHERIRVPNAPLANTICTEKSFRDSLKIVVNHPPFLPLKSDQLAKLLDNYWGAIADLCPGAFRFPKKHQIQRTTGLFVLHRLLPEAFDRVLKGSKDSSVSRKGFRELFKNVIDASAGRGRGVKVFQDEYWSSAGIAGQFGTSQKAFHLLYSRIQEGLMAMDDQGVGGISYSIE